MANSQLNSFRMSFAKWKSRVSVMIVLVSLGSKINKRGDSDFHCILTSMCLLKRSAHFCLNARLKTTSRGWMRDVHPGGMSAGVVPIFLRDPRTCSVFWAAWTYATNSDLPFSFWMAGAQSSSTQSSIMLSSHHALSWNFTWTLLSQAAFSSSLIFLPVPRNIIMGFTRGSPSAKMVSCTVHCLLSWPLCPPLIHTVFAPFSVYVFSPPKTKGIGVWSMFATICDPASQNHQKVARHGFLVKGRF